jgi:hypothetical protein
VWLAYPVLPDKNLIVIPREDDLMFGLLHNRFHEAWALRKGSDLEDRPRYTHTTTFATFPFPDGMTPNADVEKARQLPTAPAIEVAAHRLNQLRHQWLYPANLIMSAAEVVSGFPDRLVATDQNAERLLAARTLTNLYNEKPDWLIEAHRAIDIAVAAAYNWPADISEDDALARLFELNQARAGGASGLLPNLER